MTRAGISLNPFVRALSLTGFEPFARQLGLDPLEMLRKVSLPADILGRQDSILSYHRYCALLELCASQLHMPLFGLHFGLYQGISVFGDLLCLIRNASTVGAALVELRTNFSLYNGAALVDLDVQGKRALLRFTVSNHDIPALSQAEELACGVAIQLMRTLAGSDWHPQQIHLRHTARDQHRAYLDALGCRPTFSASCTGLEFEAATLTLPLSTGDKGLHQVVAEHLNRMERLTTDELPNYVRQLLRDLLPGGRATLETIADCMVLHPRALQRRLTQENTSFQELLDDTRQNMAHKYLQDPAISMAQIAELLGYSNPGAFSRAFHRWFLATPLAWQRVHGAKKQPLMLSRRRSTGSG